MKKLRSQFTSEVLRFYSCFTCLWLALVETCCNKLEIKLCVTVLVIVCFILVAQTHTCTGLPNGLFPSGFHTKTPYVFLLSPISTTFPTHLILFGFITPMTCRTEYKPNDSIQDPVTCPSGPNSSFSTLLSNTHTHIHTHTNTHIHTHKHTYTHTHKHTCIHICLHTYIHT